MESTKLLRHKNIWSHPCAQCAAHKSTHFASFSSPSPPRIPGIAKTLSPSFQNPKRFPLAARVKPARSALQHFTTGGIINAHREDGVKSDIPWASCVQTHVADTGYAGAGRLLHDAAS